MGMDYSYAGSASYRRFDRELCAVAEICGGIKTEYLKEQEEKYHDYLFGFLSSDESDNTKFIFPEGTSEVLVKWFNNIYSEDFTAEETKIVWEYISKHTEIEEISDQIWYELKMCSENNDAWYIF